MNLESIILKKLKFGNAKDNIPAAIIYISCGIDENLAIRLSEVFR